MRNLCLRFRLQTGSQRAITVSYTHLDVYKRQGGQLLGVRRVETGMNVINAEAELVAQNAGGTDVGGDHRLFDNAVGNATRMLKNPITFSS